MEYYIVEKGKELNASINHA